jgi:tetratricopeptide (TPR) repeat protein
MQKWMESARDWHVYVAIIVLGTALYGKSVFFEYTYADDTQLLVVNQEFLSHLSNLPKLFTTEVFLSMPNPNLYYRPLLNLFFMLLFQISDGSLWCFHLVNLLIHLGCSILVYSVFQRLKLSQLHSLLCALIFCVHPMLTSAVTWIPGINDTLVTFFILSSFLLFLQALQTKSKSRFLGHVILLFLALLTKEGAIVFPLICLLYLAFVQDEPIRRKNVVRIVFAYGAVTAAWFLLRAMVSLNFAIHQTAGDAAAVWMNNLPVLVLYFGKVILPFNLSIYPNLQDHSLWLGFAGIILCAGALIWEKPKIWIYIFSGLSWFVLFLLPSLLVGIIFHEHRAYCSLAGILFALAQFPLLQKIDIRKTYHFAGAVLLIAVLFLLTFVHEEQFRNRQSYAISAFHSDPSVDASYLGLAGMYIDEGNDDMAEKIIHAGIAQKPDMQMVHRQLADIYVHRGAYLQAKKEYETSLKIEPLHLYTYINYGKLCLQTGAYDQAAHLWKTSVAINPEFILGYYYLANYYVHTKIDPDSAMFFVREIQNHGSAVMPELLESIEALKSGR